MKSVSSLYIETSRALPGASWLKSCRMSGGENGFASKGNKAAHVGLGVGREKAVVSVSVSVN